MFRARVTALTALLLCASAGATDSAPPTLAPLAPLAGPRSTAWQFAGLPDQAIAPTTFEVIRDATGPALRITAQRSYGALLHSLPPGSGARALRWRWRAVRLNDLADLRQKAGDDLSLKICVMFDLPLRAVPRVERWTLRLARLRTGLTLPAATLCYGWDSRLPAGTLLDNAYSRRVRILILRQGLDTPPQWQREQRDLAQDFHAAFGAEFPDGLPAITAVAVGADNDNTGGHSEGDIADLEFARPSPH